VRFVCHGRHHVVLRSNVDGLLDAVAAYCERLIAREPHGAHAGTVHAFCDADGSIVVESGEIRRTFTGRGTAARAIVHATLRAMIDARNDLIWLHAAALADAQGAWLFAAPCGAGKSSLAGELVARGWIYLSDEIAAIDPRDGTVAPFPLTPWRRVGSPSARLSAEDVRALSKVRVPLEDAGVAAGPVPIARVCLLEFAHEATPPRVTSVAPAQAVASLIALTFGSPATRETELRGFAGIVSRVPVVHVAHASSREVAAWLAQSSTMPRAAEGARVVPSTARLAGAAA
jgi:hypothetical protein